MLRENVAGLLSNSRGSLHRADSTHDLSQRPLPTSSSGPTCEVTSCRRKRSRSFASPSSTALRRWDSDAHTPGDSLCMGCVHHVPILQAEIVDLKKQLNRAKMRIKELGGEKACGFRDTEGEVDVLKTRIRCLLRQGDITQEQVLGGTVTRKLFSNGFNSSSLQLALSDIQKEIAAESKRSQEDADRKAMEEYDRRQLKVVECNPDARPEDVIEETTRKLLACYEKTKEASIENKFEHIDIKSIYISIRRTLAKSHEELMRCPRGSVQELIGACDQGETNNGPDPADGRQLLINKYMADDPPHDDLITDAFDSSAENDARILVRLITGVHIMGLPGSQTSAISEDAKSVGDFGTHLFNGHGNLEFVEAIRELKNIVETRRGSSALIYTQKLLDHVMIQILEASKPKQRHNQVSKPKRKGNAPQRWPPGVLRSLPAANRRSSIHQRLFPLESAKGE